MLDLDAESMLQGVATDMAFLELGNTRGVLELMRSVQGLRHTPFVHGRADVQHELAVVLDWCNKILADGGLAACHNEGLRRSFERLTDIMYLSDGATQRHERRAPQADSQVADLGFCIAAGDDFELLSEFCTEGRDLLAQVEHGVLVLEQNPRHKDTLHQVFRAFHTLKGGAGLLGITSIQQLAHQLESLLDAARRDDLPVTRTVIEVILAGADALQRCVDAITQQLQGMDRGHPIVVPTGDLLQRIGDCLSATTTRPDHARGTLTIERVHESGSDQALESREQASQELSQSESAGPKTPTPVTATRRDTRARQVTLDTQKLDSLLDLVGELLVTQSMVVEHPWVQKQAAGELQKPLRQLLRITKDLQNNAMSLRMVPVRAVFQRLNRLVRDLTLAQNKKVQLHLSGEDVELDRHIVESLADPLLHMVRNALDHGIETPAERLRQGKPEQGHIYVEAAHQDGGIVIRVRDDGRGLDAQKILTTALRCGTHGVDKALSEQDIYKLIFEPGFSTADKVSDVSGRGVGMDVVLSRITQLRGRVDIESYPGRGTSFHICLPLTLAIIDGVVVGVGQERFIVPTLAVRESLRLQPGMVSTVQDRGEVIEVRKQIIPLTRLAEKLGITGAAINPCDGIAVVIDSGARTRALLVDRLIGKQEVIIKSLGQAVQQHAGLSGAAIMGDGRVALIIDPDAVSQMNGATALAA